MIVSVSHQCNIKFLVLFLFLSIVYENDKTKKTKYILICYNQKILQIMNMFAFVCTMTYFINFFGGPNWSYKILNVLVRNWKPCFSRICKKSWRQTSTFFPMNRWMSKYSSIVMQKFAQAYTHAQTLSTFLENSFMFLVIL